MSLTTLWVLLGTGLLVAEVLSGTFVLLFFSLGAFAAALLAVLGVSAPEIQILACGVVSALGFFLLRKPLQKKMLRSKESVHVDLGKTLRAESSLKVGGSVRISYQGTTWEARNTGNEDIAQGELMQITGTDGNILLVNKQTVH